MNENVLQWTQSVLSTTPARWSQMAAALPTELLRRPPAAKEWSAVECLLHLIDTERAVFPLRVRAFLAGQDFPAYHPESQGTKPDPAQSPAALAEEFAHLRQDTLTLLASLEPADLDRKARHAELGPVTLGEMLNEWAAHDLTHTVQAERAMMQPFIQGCGPWQVYFADHFVKPGK